MQRNCRNCKYRELDLDDVPCNTCDEDDCNWVDNDVPTLLNNPSERLRNLKIILNAEVAEIDDIPENGDIDTLVALADLLGDITVYCRSEALKYGIPLESVLDIIMDSNESKVGGGKDETGKFLKGPNYWKPEPKIKELLLQLMENK